MITSKNKLVGLRLEPELYDFLEDQASKEHCSIQELIRKALWRIKHVVE